MYKLILVDDKPNVTEGIRRFGDWGACEVEVVGIAGDGREALQIIQKYQPDIAITDIAMPLMDGLAFTEEALKINPLLKIIILSGYDQFDYAQHAIQLGVMQYLLKPVKIEQIVAAVKKACQQLHVAQNTVQELSNLRLQQKSVERQQHLITLLEDHTPWNERILAYSPSQLHELSLLTNEAGYQLIVFQPVELAKVNPAHFFPMLMEGGFVLALNNNGVAMVGQAQVEALKHKLLELNPVATIALSRPYRQLNDLIVAYQEALQALSFSLFSATQHTGQVILAEELAKGSHQPVYPNRVEREILMVVRAGNARQIEELVDQFYQELGQTTASPGYVRAASLELLVVTARNLNEDGTRLESSGNFVAQIESCQSLSRIKTIVTEMLIDYAQQVAIRRNGKNKSPVDLAVKFIQANLHRDISLDEVATHTNFTPGYMAHVFKKTTGQTVLEYISQRKMERAAEMVCDPDAKIVTVAQLLGYSDRRYFSELFRRHFGCTPSEYRERVITGVPKNG